jgi:hypothetical protein
MHQILFLKRIILVHKVLITFLLCLLFLFACASSKSGGRPSVNSLKIGDPALCKAVTYKGELTLPVQLTKEFTTEDKEVISHLTFINLTGEHRIRWEWYDPKGNLFETTGNIPLKVGKNEYVREGTAWHGLKLNITQAVNHPGEWSVRIYKDDELVAVNRFILKKLISSAEIAGIDFGKYPVREKQSKTPPTVTMKTPEEIKMEDESNWLLDYIAAIGVANSHGCDRGME